MIKKIFPLLLLVNIAFLAVIPISCISCSSYSVNTEKSNVMLTAIFDFDVNFNYVICDISLVQNQTDKYHISNVQGTLIGTINTVELFDSGLISQAQDPLMEYSLSDNISLSGNIQNYNLQIQLSFHNATSSIVFNESLDINTEILSSETQSNNPTLPNFQNNGLITINLVDVLFGLGGLVILCLILSTFLLFLFVLLRFR